MNVPKPLALPHLVQFSDENPRVIAKAIIESAKSMPTFNYRSVDPVLMKFMLGNFSTEQLADALRRKAPEGKADLFAELAEPLHEALWQKRPKYVHKVDRQMLTIPGGLTVPFDPGFVYIPQAEERLILPYRLYWKTRRLNERSLRLFFSLARELILEDDDIVEAELQLITMPAAASGGRYLKIYRATDFQLLSSREMNAFLNSYREGFEIARDKLSNIPARPKSQRPSQNPSLPLFKQ